MGAKTKLSMREASGAVTLVIVILLVQIGIFIIQPEVAKEQHNSTEQSNLSDQFVLKEGVGLKEGIDLKEATNKKSLNLKSRGSVYESRGSISQGLASIGSQNKAKFRFDPNIVSVEELIELGLTPKQAAVIIKYRAKGGVFKTSEDLKKIYVLPNGFYDRVKDSIYIENQKDVGLSKNIGSSKEIASSKKSNNELNAHTNNELLAHTKNETTKSNNSLKPNLTVPIIELNDADSAALLSLPGIGPYYAGKIIEFRKKTGGLISAHQLMEIKGIDSSRLAQFSHMVYADTLKIVKTDLGKVTLNELSRNPHIGSYLARSIVRFRDIVGKESINLAFLVLNNIIAPEMLKNLRHYFN